jgi:ABC-type sugar transport system permease subunit
VLETQTPVRRPVGTLGGVDWTGWFSASNVLPLLLLAAVAFAAVYPLAMILLSSFRGGVPGVATPLTLDSWRIAFADPTTIRVFFSTMLVAVPRSILGLTLGVIFAWIMARTNTPGRRWLQGMLAFMFFLPDLPWILAWTLMGQPRVGLLNQWLSALLSTPTDVFNVYSYGGLIVLGAARSAVYLYLFLYPPFLAMDSRLEEAARISGATARRAVLRIYLPLMAPALLGAGILSVINSMSSFDLEQLLGVPAGISVFTTKIYEDIYGGEGKFGPASALAMMLLALTFLLLLVQWKLLANKSYVTISGRGYSAEPSDIGGWRFVAFGFVLVYFLIFGVLPFVILIIQSFMSYTGLIRGDMITTEYWTRVLSDVSVLGDLKNDRCNCRERRGIHREPHALGRSAGARCRRLVTLGSTGHRPGPGLPVGLRVSAHLWHAQHPRAGFRLTWPATRHALRFSCDGADRAGVGGIRPRSRRILSAHVRAHLGAAAPTGSPGSVDSPIRLGGPAARSGPHSGHGADQNARRGYLRRRYLRLQSR